MKEMLTPELAEWALFTDAGRKLEAGSGEDELPMNGQTNFQEMNVT